MTECEGEERGRLACSTRSPSSTNQAQSDAISRRSLACSTRSPCSANRPLTPPANSSASAEAPKSSHLRACVCSTRRDAPQLWQGGCGREAVLSRVRGEAATSPSRRARVPRKQSEAIRSDQKRSRDISPVHHVELACLGAHVWLARARCSGALSRGLGHGSNQKQSEAISSDLERSQAISGALLRGLGHGRSRTVVEGRGKVGVRSREHLSREPWRRAAAAEGRALCAARPLAPLDGRADAARREGMRGVARGQWEGEGCGEESGHAEQRTAGATRCASASLAARASRAARARRGEGCARARPTARGRQGRTCHPAPSGKPTSVLA